MTFTPNGNRSFVKKVAKSSSSSNAHLDNYGKECRDRIEGARRKKPGVSETDIHSELFGKK